MGRVTHYDTVQMLTGLLARREAPYFTVEVRSETAPFTYSFTPYITAGESFWVDWGDGSEDTYATAGTSEKSHEYASAGTKTIRMLGSSGINKVTIGAATDTPAPRLVINSNGAWNRLGNITDGTNMFNWCTNALFEFKDVPPNLLAGYRMFHNCFSAPLAISELPTGMNGSVNAMFANCYEASLTISAIPLGVTKAGSIFAYCYKSSVPITQLPSNKPSVTTYDDMFRQATACTVNVDALTGNYSYVTNITRMFFNCPLVTGDAGAFVARCAPGVTVTAAFRGTACTNIPA